MLSRIGARVAVSPAQVTLEDQDTDLGNKTIYTFSGMNFGAADADRWIWILGGGYDGSTGANISSVTIGGITATTVFKYGFNPPGRPSLVRFAYRANVPTGTTGDVVLTFNQTMNDAGIGVFRAMDVSNWDTYFTTAENYHEFDYDEHLGGTLMGNYYNANGGQNPQAVAMNKRGGQSNYSTTDYAFGVGVY